MFQGFLSRYFVLSNHRQPSPSACGPILPDVMPPPGRTLSLFFFVVKSWVWIALALRRLTSYYTGRPCKLLFRILTKSDHAFHKATRFLRPNILHQFPLTDHQIRHSETENDYLYFISVLAVHSTFTF